MKASKKLVGAIVALAAAASLTVGSTFAWFTARNTVSTDEINLGVTSGSGSLQIAVVKDAGTPVYGYSTKLNDLVPAGTAFEALTSSDGGQTLKEKGASNATAKTNSYVTFELKFRTDVSGGKLVLGQDSKITASEDATDASYPAVYVWEPVEGEFETDTAIAGSTAYGDTALGVVGSEIKAKAAHAARVSFIQTSGYKVWAPFESRETGDDTVKTSDTVGGFYKGNLAADYLNHLRKLDDPSAAKENITAETYGNNRVYSAQSATETDDKNVIATFGTIADGDTYAELTLTVKIWLEGTDGDCLDSILKDTFKVKLGFRVVPPASGV